MTSIAKPPPGAAWLHPGTQRAYDSWRTDVRHDQLRVTAGWAGVVVGVTVFVLSLVLQWGWVWALGAILASVATVDLPHSLRRDQRWRGLAGELRALLEGRPWAVWSGALTAKVEVVRDGEGTEVTRVVTWTLVDEAGAVLGVLATRQDVEGLHDVVHGTTPMWVCAHPDGRVGAAYVPNRAGGLLLPVVAPDA